MAERPEDLSLPASVVARIIKDALPDGVNVSKEARTAIGKAASVFILYATACANNFALKNKRKTLSAGDVFSALQDMEFEEFIPELKDCLEAYKQEQRGRREAAADRKKRVLLPSTSSEAVKVATDVAMDTAATMDTGLTVDTASLNAVASNCRPAGSEHLAIGLSPKAHSSVMLP